MTIEVFERKLQTVEENQVFFKPHRHRHLPLVQIDRMGPLIDLPFPLPVQVVALQSFLISKVYTFDDCFSAALFVGSGNELSTCSLSLGYEDDGNDAENEIFF